MEKRIFDTGMYIIDKEYHILNCNYAMKQMYPEVNIGDLCYQALAKYDSPCPTCPLATNDVLFFNPIRKEWISANAAEIDYPGYGECYNVQFKMRKSIGGTKKEIIRLEKIDEYISELQSNIGNECVIGAYCEAGSPIFFANENMVSFMGYDDIDEMMEAIDGLVVNTIHPDDRKRVRQDLEGTEKKKDIFETTYRIRKKDGSWVWIIARGKVIATATGKMATICVCNDMSTFLKHHSILQERNNELLLKEAQTEVLMNKIPGSYHRCSTEEGYPFLYISESFEETVGWTKKEIEEKFDNKFINLVWPEDIHLFNGLVNELEVKGNASSIYRIKHKEKGYRWVQDSTMYIEFGENSFYQCTIADITPYLDELEEAKARAEASSKAKSAFLFNASHDIRTPMNAIHGFTQMIKENAGDEQQVRNIVAKIEKSSDMLMKLLNDVLELSRIESGKEEVEPVVTDLVSFIDKLKTMFAKEMEDAGIVFKQVRQITNQWVWCDELKLMQIVMNMLSNAKKFTQAGGEIVFGIEQMPCEDTTAATFRIFVKDSGIGMSEEFLARAFEQFERERTATESGVIGSGLGLSIIKKLTELMGGKCTLQSTFGKGTEIASIIRFSFAENEPNNQEEDILPQKDFSGKRLLLVEDNDFNREVAGFILEKLNVFVEEAENGFEAVNKLKNAEAGYYDLILMDIQMPVMDGYTATKEIRCLSNPVLANIPIIAMTANAFKEDQDRCFAVGMNRHLSKPIDANELTKVMSELL